MLLIVLMFVPLTSVACFASSAVCNPEMSPMATEPMALYDRMRTSSFSDRADVNVIVVPSVAVMSASASSAPLTYT